MAAVSETATSGLGGSLTSLQRLKAILGGSAGNFVEWYDWFAYSAFTLYFADHFFPKGDQTAQLLQAAAAHAARCWGSSSIAPPTIRRTPEGACRTRFERAGIRSRTWASTRST